MPEDPGKDGSGAEQPVNETAPVAHTVAESHRFRWRGAVGAVVLVPVFLVTLFSTPALPASSWAAAGLNLAGWAAFVAGAGMRVWATLYIGGRKERDLMTEGPYSICRNPLYVGSLLLMVGAGLLMKSLVFTVAVAVVAAVYLVATVPIEEQYLRATHGEAFDRYAARVPRIVPSLAAFHTPPTIEVTVRALRLECARASRWIWLPAVALGVAWLRQQPSWPTFFTLP
jgi:protein-S-isoprenylcysteine O-methyltransferase Ste14